MIFAGGASGTGKTTALERFVARHPDFVHLRASSILRDFWRPTEKPSPPELEENQQTLRNALLAKRLTSKTILDGHLTIPVGDHLFQVPASFFKDLPLRAFVFMQTEPRRLLQRKGIEATADALAMMEMLQRSELQQMRHVAAERGCPIEVVNPQEEDVLERVLLHYGTI
ncbi:AAA family ATPase [Ensifer aridi]|uniref:AAA family ATPase n=1 Tax=Ensifer aridi TaxID=1708715 RepID=UPI0009BE486A|nr:AAA family ATPase [Ensifer aridi]